jgi:hypothetical protein
MRSGGCKGGDDRFYDKFVPLADRIYDDHLATLRKEDEAAKRATQKQKKR